MSVRKNQSKVDSDIWTDFYTPTPVHRLGRADDLKCLYNNYFIAKCQETCLKMQGHENRNAPSDLNTNKCGI